MLLATVLSRCKGGQLSYSHIMRAAFPQPALNPTFLADAGANQRRGVHLHLRLRLDAHSRAPDSHNTSFPKSIGARDGVEFTLLTTLLVLGG